MIEYRPEDRIELHNGIRGEILDILSYSPEPEYLVQVEGRDWTLTVKKSAIANRIVPLRPVPLSKLVQSFSFYRNVVMLDRGAVILMHQGEILGFLRCNLPDTIPCDRSSTARFAKTLFTVENIRQWRQEFDVVELTLCSRTRAYFIGSQHRNWLLFPCPRTAIAKVRIRSWMKWLYEAS